VERLALAGLPWINPSPNTVTPFFSCPLESRAAGGKLLALSLATAVFVAAQAAVDGEDIDARGTGNVSGGSARCRPMQSSL
jgi:hypothetical protein